MLSFQGGEYLISESNKCCWEFHMISHIFGNLAGCFSPNMGVTSLVRSSCWIKAVQTLTLLRHSHGEAPLEPTVLTAVPRDLVDDAVFVPMACVDHVLLNAATEEALQCHHGGKRRLVMSSLEGLSLKIDRIVFHMNTVYQATFQTI